MAPKVRPPEERFWSKVSMGEGCWEWLGGRGHFGHGNFYVKVDGKQKCVGAHRYSWELHNGPIPDGLQVNHTCDNPSCVNPQHLYTGTQRENMRDRLIRGRNPYVNKTECKYGHSDWKVRKNGRRRCAECHRNTERSRRGR